MNGFEDTEIIDFTKSRELNKLHNEFSALLDQLRDQASDKNIPQIDIEDVTMYEIEGFLAIGKIAKEGFILKSQIVSLYAALSKIYERRFSLRSNIDALRAQINRTLPGNHIEQAVRNRA